MTDEQELPPLPEADGMLENGYLYVILSKVGQHGRSCFDAGRAPLVEEIERLKARHLVNAIADEKMQERAEAAERELHDTKEKFSTWYPPDYTHGLEKSCDELRTQLEAERSSVAQLTEMLNKEIIRGDDNFNAAEKYKDQLEAAQKDAERLDWLDAQWKDGVHVEVCSVNAGRGADSLGRFATVFTSKSGGRGNPNVRMAIDAARAKKP